MRKILLLLAALLVAMPAVRAETVVLVGGSRLSGVVLDRTGERILLLLPRGDEIRLAAADVAEVVPDEDDPAPGAWFRYREPGDRTGGLDVAVTHCVDPEGGPRVDLVSAVHIADAAFYQEVQRLLDNVDVVLYEGIKPADLSGEEFQQDEGAEENVLRQLQRRMAGWFSLSFQLDGIDYSRPHFRHADLTAEEFAAAEGGGDADSGDAAGMPGQMGRILKLVEAMGPAFEKMFGQPGPQRDQMKRMFARILGTQDLPRMIGTFMPGLSDLLIAKRNAVVVEKIGAERGREGIRSIAVFYGAAHMPDLERALLQDLGYRRAGARWLQAWEIPALPKQPAPK